MMACILLLRIHRRESMGAVSLTLEAWWDLFRRIFIKERRFGTDLLSVGGIDDLGRFEGSFIMQRINPLC
jgi:hypothetical protein